MKVRILVAACAIAVGLAFAGQAQALDTHLKCYKVKKLTTPFPGTANLNDSIGGSVNAEIKKAFLFCNPVSKNGSAVNDPDPMVCYKIKADKQESTQNVTNQFGATSLVAKKAFLLCVPSTF
ncbi:MAG TPA: hypothetical protein VFW62_01260 [bacterium]|nr:hypothetical protein [bacterium]